MRGAGRPNVWTAQGDGDAVEDKAFYFLPELEQVIREWVATVYHRRPHHGLVDPAVPGLDLSPMDMYEHGIARAGRLRVPARKDLVYDFLPVAWRTVQHYGVEVNGLRYNGDALCPYRNARSPYYRGANPGKWPIRYDPDDITKVFFQDPDDGQWHTLVWEHAAQIDLPFNAEALAYARRLRRPDRPLRRRSAGAGRAAGAMGCRAHRQPHRAADGVAPLPATRRPPRRRAHRARGRQGPGHRAGPVRRRPTTEGPGPGRRRRRRPRRDRRRRRC